MFICHEDHLAGIAPEVNLRNPLHAGEKGGIPCMQERKEESLACRRERRNPLHAGEEGGIPCMQERKEESLACRRERKE